MRTFHGFEPFEARIRIRIRVKGGIRIRSKVTYIMRIRNTGQDYTLQALRYRYNQGAASSDAAKSPTASRGAQGPFLFPGPSHLYSGPTPGAYSANSTPSGLTPYYTGQCAV